MREHDHKKLNPLGFSRHIRSLRKVRRQTQEVLAERSKLAVDTIRRLERGTFSPSLDTIWKVTNGLELSLSTLFIGFELGSVDSTLERQVIDLLAHRPRGQIRMAMLILRAVFAELDEAEAVSRDVDH